MNLQFLSEEYTETIGSEIERETERKPKQYAAEMSSTL